MGGSLDNPSYKEVKTGLTGHLETIRVEYDPEVVSYEALVKYFFEIHDFEQADGQGIDIGTQYLSAIWFQNAEERDTALKVFGDLIKMGGRNPQNATFTERFSKSSNRPQGLTPPPASPTHQGSRDEEWRMRPGSLNEVSPADNR